ncbi:MAG: hypothetical protein V4574_16405 [Pseudomonadota bacterium]
MFDCLVLAALMLFFSYWGMPIGGGVYAGISSLGRLPWVGGIFRFVLGGPAPLAFPVKLLGWAISSSGLLIALWLFQRLFGAPAGRAEHWIMLAVAVATILRNLERSVFFDVYQHIDIRSVAKFWRFPHDQLDMLDRMRSKLALVNYVDMNVCNFFSLLVAYGIALYAAGALGLLPVAGAPPGLGEAMWQALSLANVGHAGRELFTGPAWQVVSGIASFITMLYLALFISLGANLIDDLMKAHDDEMAVMKAEIDAIAASPTPASPPETAGPAPAPPPPETPPAIPAATPGEPPAKA